MTSNLPVKKQRLQFIDIARGIAMISIIIGHLGEPAINRVVFTFHVPVFFFITGYFLSDKKSIKDFIKNKARTLLVPYAVTCAVIVFTGIMIGLRNGNAGDEACKWLYASVYGAGDNYQEPFYIKGIGAIWFLWATFWGSMFLRISLKFNSVFRVLFVLGLFIAGYFSRELFWFPLSIQAGACATLFMYLGYLLKCSKDRLKEIPIEVKAIGVIIAALVWLQFMINFKSFWLVHCDIGRGIIDIIGCICACAVVVFISWLAEYKRFFLVKPLALIGKYSLLVLCVHIVELTFVPWRRIADLAISYGMPDGTRLAFLIIGKIVFVLFITWICSRIPAVRRVMGYS